MSFGLFSPVDFEIAGLEKGLLVFGNATHYVGVSLNCSKFFSCLVRDALIEDGNIVTLQEDLTFYPEDTTEYVVFRRILCIRYQWSLPVGARFIGSTENRVFINTDDMLCMYTFEGDQCVREILHGNIDSMYFRRLA